MPTRSRYVDDLLAVTTHRGPDRRRAGADLVEPLSSREVTVLRYLCSRLTYQEIAAALYVSLNTLKSHVQERVPQARRRLAWRMRSTAGRRSGRDLTGWPRRSSGLPASEAV